MATQTTNLQLTKPDDDDFYDVGVQNDNMDIIDEEITELKKSVSDGKATVASAITAQGVTTASNAAFATMATNIGTVGTNKYNAGVAATKKGTAAAAQVLTGYTFTNASSVGASGSMTNNGAVTKTLAINGTYTIPAGYHNGSGKVTQSIITKAAATYTPGDSAQTIASGVYLSGTQTISAVPTETKTATAGTAATTVSRTSGKYMTSVTINPTPSQTKTVTMTSSPLTITPDSGKLLSSVTVNASLGKKYASGIITPVLTYLGASGKTYYAQLSSALESYASSNEYKVTLPVSFTPKIIRLTFTYAKTSANYQCLVTKGQLVMNYDCTNLNNAGYNYRAHHYSAGNVQLTSDCINIWMPYANNLGVTNETSIEYEAWE